MPIVYKNAESLEMPLETDLSSSSDGIYVRRNIKKIETDDGFKYQYQEAFMSKDQYESYSKELLVNQLNGEDNTAEYENYKKQLDSGVQYLNGKHYKPKWTELYAKIMKDFKDTIELYEKVGGDITPLLSIKTSIYDVTGKTENAVAMTVKEIIDLWLFLYQQKERLFNEYKQSVVEPK